MDVTTAEPPVQDEADTTTTQTTASAESMDSFWLTFLGVVPLLGLLPLMAVEALKIWERPHYRFAPLALIAACALIAINFRDARPDRKRFLVASIISAVGCLLGLVSIWFFLPQLAQLSLVILLYGWLLGQLGETRWSRILALVFLVAVTVPLPFHLDIFAMRALQSAAARCTSYALDSLGILHMLSGTAISGHYFTIPTTRVAGGPDSFFFFLGLAAIALAARRHGYFATTLLLISVPIWSIAYGVICQTILGMYGNTLITSGQELPFMLVRAIAFVVVVISFILMEVGLLGLTRPASWSKLSEDEWLIEDEIMRYRPPVEYASHQAVSRMLSMPVGLTLLVAGVLSALLIARNYENVFATNGYSFQAANDIGKPDAFPEIIEDWKRAEFWIDNNLAYGGVVVPQYHWRYSRGLENVSFALTVGAGQQSPVSSYQEQKWRVVEDSSAKDKDETADKPAFPFEIIQLRNSLGGQAFLMLSNIDVSGKVLPANQSARFDESPWRTIFAKLASTPDPKNQHLFEVEAFYPTIAEQKQMDPAAMKLVATLLQIVSREAGAILATADGSPVPPQPAAQATPSPPPVQALTP